MAASDSAEVPLALEPGLSSLSETQAARLLSTAVLLNAMILTDPRLPDNPIVYHNLAFEVLTGYSPQEIDGRNCRFLQGAETDPADVGRIREAISLGQPAQLTLTDHRKDGTPFWNELTLAPLFDGMGAITHWVGVQTDITGIRDSVTALREGEERLRLAMESGGLGSWDLDLNTGRYLSVSDTWKTHFGLPPEAELPDLSQDDFLQMLHPEDRERVRSLADHAARDRTEYAAGYRSVWEDGSVHWISAHARPVYDGAGRAVRLIGVTRDVTEEKGREAERERELAEARERADRDPLTGLFNHASFQRRLAEETVRAQREGTTLAAVMLDLDNFKFFNDAYGHAAGDGVIRLVAARLQALCRPYDTLARFGGDEFALLLPGVDGTAVADVETRLKADLAGLTYKPDGEASAIPLTLSVGAALFPRDAPERAALLGLADERLMRAKTGGEAGTEAERVRLSLTDEIDGFSMLDALVTAVDNKDRYTRCHSEDVLMYSLMIADELGLGEEERRTVEVAALLHDVGKIGVPDRILRKPGRLTDEEFAAIRQHPQMGAVMVSSVDGLEGTLDAVRHHHERWDGGGYPSGLSEEQTPLMARLMAVADAFSAMTTDRPYRQGMAEDKAVSILEGGSGSQWDPACVRAFVAAHGKRHTAEG